MPSGIVYDWQKSDELGLLVVVSACNIPFIVNLAMSNVVDDGEPFTQKLITSFIFSEDLSATLIRFHSES